MDHFFGVTNNKQDLTDIEHLAPGDMTDVADDAREGDEKAIFRTDFQRVLTRILKELKSAVDKRSGGTRGGGRTKPIIEVVQGELDQGETTGTDKEVEGIDQETLIQEKIDLILGEDSSLSDEDARKIAMEQKHWKLDVTLDSWRGQTFIDVRRVGNAATLFINTDHAFYKEFYQPIDEMKDKKPIKALQAILYAYARSEDISRNANPKELFDDLRDDWGRYIKRMIQHANN